MLLGTVKNNSQMYAAEMNKNIWLYMWKYADSYLYLFDTYFCINNWQSYFWNKARSRLFENFHGIVKWMLMLTAFRCSNNSDLTRALSLYSWTEVPFKSVFHGLPIFMLQASLRRWIFIVNKYYFEVRILAQLCNNCKNDYRTRNCNINNTSSINKNILDICNIVRKHSNYPHNNWIQ